MVLKRRADEDPMPTKTWMENSLRLAREQDRPRVLRLLKAVSVEVDLESALLALPTGAHLAYGRGQSPAPPDAPSEEDVLAQRRAREKARRRLESERKRQKVAAWEDFLRSERRELELRKEGRLARLLGDPLPGEDPEALKRLASEDRRQAREGLVALMSGGKTSYKYLKELTEEDMPARVAAEGMRTVWLKDRRDAWLARPSPKQPAD